MGSESGSRAGARALSQECCGKVDPRAWDAVPDMVIWIKGDLSRTRAYQ